MLTEVAVRIVPTNTASSHPPAEISPQRSAAMARPAPMSSGVKTPSSATQKPAFPDSFRSWMLVPMPAVNRITITPNSEIWSKNSVSCSIFSIEGPSRRPASSDPTTWGI